VVVVVVVVVVDSVVQSTPETPGDVASVDRFHTNGCCEQRPLERVFACDAASN
jgi:hypothetical protein